MAGVPHTACLDLGYRCSTWFGGSHAHHGHLKQGADHVQDVMSCDAKQCDVSLCALELSVECKDRIVERCTHTECLSRGSIPHCRIQTGRPVSMTPDIGSANLWCG